MTSDNVPPVEELLCHEAWLRPLVRSLVAADDVDDVLQQTWFAALEGQRVERPASWLRSVARNLAVSLRRGKGVRDGRAARGGAAVQSVDEVLPIHRFEKDQHQERMIVGLIDGRSPSLTTSLRARRLSILDRDGKEIERVDVHLEVGRVTVLQR